MSIQLQLQNKIINGAFDFWQRGTSFPAAANNVYVADRWQYNKSSATVVHTLTREADVPTSAFGQFSLKTTVTTAQASISTGDAIGLKQKIEGNVLRSFNGKKVAISFWVKSNIIGQYSLSVRNATFDRSLVKGYTILAANTWEKKTIRFTHNSVGTWDYTTGVGIDLYFAIGSGLSLQTSPDVWVGGNFVAATGQVNNGATIGNTFFLSDVCLVEDNEGQTRNPDFVYAGRDYFEEFQLCQRYFEKSYNLTDAPGTSTGDNIPLGASTTSGNYGTTVAYFKTAKRITPVITLYDAAGTINRISAFNGGGWVQTNGISSTGTFITQILVTVRQSNATGLIQHYAFHFTADSEL